MICPHCGQHREKSRVNQLALDHQTLSPIRLALCEIYGITMAALDGDRRKAALAEARMIGYFLSLEKGISTPRIGRVFGGRDHTTVISGDRTLRNKLRSTPRLETLISRVRARAEELASAEREAA